MKLLLALAVVVCGVAVSQAAPQLFATASTLLIGTLYNVIALLGQISTLLPNILGTVQTQIQNVLSIFGQLSSLPSSTLNTVNQLLSNAVKQISDILLGANLTNLSTLVPAFGNIQTILASTANSLAALNVTTLAPLQGALNSLVSAISTGVGQIAG